MVQGCGWDAVDTPASKKDEKAAKQEERVAESDEKKSQKELHTLLRHLELYNVGLN